MVLDWLISTNCQTLIALKSEIDMLIVLDWLLTTNCKILIVLESEFDMLTVLAQL